MAYIETRKNAEGETTYRVQVALKGYPRQNATFKRLTDAKKWAQHTEAAIREGRHFKTAEAKRHTLAETLDRYEREYIKPKEIQKAEKKNGENDAKKNRSIVNVRHYFNWWRSRLGAYVLADITASTISEARSSLLGQENKYGRAIGATTANRYVTALSHVFTIAVREWEWTEVNPVSKITKYSEPRGRVRFLSDEERGRLLDACQVSDNPHLHKIVVLALSTGARKMEILGLKWKDVDLKRGMITLHETKNDERRSLPLQGYALELLKEHSKVRSLHCAYVFPSEKACQPIDIRTAWENALLNAKIEDFRFHDLRHSAASYLAMNGASLAEIAEVLGHKTLQMVKRYAHLSEAHTKEVVAAMNAKIFGAR